MRVTYTNTFGEVVRFQAIHQFFSLGYQAIIVAFCAFVYYTDSESRSNAASLATAATWFVLAWIAQILVTTFILATKRGPIDKAEHIIAIRSDALLEETRFNRSLHFWNSPMKVVRRGDLCAIYVIPQIAYIVPGHAFTSKEQRGNS
jgi:hypothetical protein